MLPSASGEKRSLKPRRRKSGQRIEEALHFGFKHRIKTFVVSVLNQGGVHTPDEISKVTGVSLGQVSYHVRELVERGLIELAEVKRKGNAHQHFYQAPEQSFSVPTGNYWDDDEYANLTEQNRQVQVGMTIHAIVAELMAAFWKKRISTDPRMWLTWDWFNLDSQGRDELAAEQTRHWNRVVEIEESSKDRASRSGEEVTSMVVIATAFKRVRFASKPPRANPE